MNPALPEIRWDKVAWNQLQKLYEYIRKDSLQNAEKIRAEIIQKVYSIPTHPSRFPEDKYKENNDGSYRCFEIHHQRIAFRVSKDVIKILRVRSTFQEPLSY